LDLQACSLPISLEGLDRGAEGAEMRCAEGVEGGGEWGEEMILLLSKRARTPLIATFVEN